MNQPLLGIVCTQLCSMPATDASIGASNLHPDNADVIREGLALGILADIAQHPIEEFLRNQGSVTTGTRAELLFIEKRARCILYLKKSISEKHNDVTFRHRTGRRRVDGRGENSHGRTPRSMLVELFGGSAVAPHVQGAGMSGVGKTQFRPRHMGDYIKTRREHRRAGLL